MASKSSISVLIGILAVAIVIIAAVSVLSRPAPAPPSTSSVITTNTTSTISNQTVITQSHNLTLAVGQSGNVILQVNPTTGTSWWVQYASPGVDITSSSATNTTHICSPQMVGCSNQLTIYSFRANAPGNYTAELRLGHAWAHSEYYEIDMVYITVQNSTSTSANVIS